MSTRQEYLARDDEGRNNSEHTPSCIYIEEEKNNIFFL